MNITILVAHHKEGLIIKDDVYLPIHVGKELSNLYLGIQGDNDGDNISRLNPIYCEMTAAYWGWKNLNADYIGLCHYRRYFTFESMPLKFVIKERFRYYKMKSIGKLLDAGSHYSYQNQLNVAKPMIFEKKANAFSEKISSVLSKNEYDVVVPRSYEIACSNVEQHFMEIGRDHMKLLKEIVSLNNPEFFPYLQKTLTTNKLYAANMFVMKKDVYDDYCKLIFDVLNAHLKMTINRGWCINPLTERCYSRVSGYLAEILTSAYINKIESERGRVLYVNSMFLAV